MILKLYHQVLGSELKSRLEKACQLLLAHSLRAESEKTAPYQIAIKIGAAAKAFGQLFENPLYETAGEALLEKQKKTKNPTAWFSPAYLADMLVSLQMIYPSIAVSPWKDFWQHIEQTWSLQSLCYIGPAIKEYQFEFQLQPTLYDLFLGYFSGKLSKRASIESPFHLHASLIRPTEDKFATFSYPLKLDGTYQEQNWAMLQQEKYAFSMIERKGLIDPAIERGLNCLHLAWGDADASHSFVCQGGNVKASTFKIESDNTFELHFDLGEMVSLEEREKCREVAFYFDVQKETQILVENSPSNTFQMGDDVTLKMADMTLSMKFAVVGGEGQFFGHIMRGNRPGQLAAKGSKKYEAYDWQIFLRTVRRSDDCKISLLLKIDP